MPVATFCLVAVDCPDPLRLAGFYRGLLGGEVSSRHDDWCELLAPDGTRLAFQRAPGFRPPDWPRADDNSQQLHLDLRVTDIEAAERHALELGARPLDTDDDGGRRDFRVYADPAGHPFCFVYGT
ncbi:VOC family protein [Streptomyces sp. CMB-StM0423]|uniref:VOC family protein n=1 Tax=Streptomyces sp. CMB-StM0423 TaxID=2059884 RepID=UPI000C6FEBAF|nr:VOC family protein [Streptomyces sp. CMB-StM0423]AUH45223.1 glyoxalase [Streptomyces sp. CMB-StM0423]